MISQARPAAKTTDVERLSEAKGEALSYVSSLDEVAATEHPSSSQRRMLNAPRRGHACFRPSPLRQAVLRAAQRVYTLALQESPEAQAYLAQRGLSLDLAVCCGLGYARGDQLIPELRRRGISLSAAREAGMLVGPEYRERFAKRIIIPELRKGQPIWMTGRSIEETPTVPRYISLPGPPPLLGKEAIGGQQVVIGCRGVFDWLTLLQWGLPAFGWLGGLFSSEDVRGLADIPAILLVLPKNRAGQVAAAKLIKQLEAERVHLLEVPGISKDVNELAQHLEGPSRFLASVCQMAARCGIERW